MKTIKDNIWCVLLFLFSFGTLNMTGEILTLCMLSYLLCFFGKNKKVDVIFLLFFAFCLFYFVNYSYYWGFSLEKMILYLFMPWACYFFGKDYSRRNSLCKIEDVMFILALGFYLHGVLNVINYLMIYGLDYQWRIAYDFWQKRVISTTGCGLYFIPLTSLCISRLFAENGWKTKLFSIIIAGSVTTCVIFSNRTLIYIVFILLILGQLFFINARNIGLRKKIIFSLSFMAWITVMICIWRANLYGIREKIMKLKLVERLLNSGSRIDLWISFLESNPWKYPLGGMQGELLGQASYVHNLWLDIFYCVGVVPFLLLVIITVCVLKQMFFIFTKELMGKKGYKIDIVFLILGMLLGCCVEPIMQNNPYYFAILVINMGLLNGVIEKQD